MSLYRESLFNIDKEKKPIIIAIGIIILIIVVFLVISSLGVIGKKETTNTRNNISLKFSKNPMVLSKNLTEMLAITIENNSEIDSTNSVITVSPIEQTFIVFCPDSIDANNSTVVIPMISKGNERTIYCDIRYANADDVLEGSYSFDVNFTLNDITTTKRTTLTVKR